MNMRLIALILAICAALGVAAFLLFPNQPGLLILSAKLSEGGPDVVERLDLRLSRLQGETYAETIPIGDDQFDSATQTLRTELEPGSYEIRLDMLGQDSLSQVFDVGGGEQVTVDLILDASLLELTVVSDTQDRLEVDFVSDTSLGGTGMAVPVGGRLSLLVPAGVTEVNLRQGDQTRRIAASLVDPTLVEQTIDFRSGDLVIQPTTSGPAPTEPTEFDLTLQGPDGQTVSTRGATLELADLPYGQYSGEIGIYSRDLGLVMETQPVELTLPQDAPLEVNFDVRNVTVTVITNPDANPAPDGTRRLVQVIETGEKGVPYGSVAPTDWGQATTIVVTPEAFHLETPLAVIATEFVPGVGRRTLAFQPIGLLVPGQPVEITLTEGDIDALCAEVYGPADCS